MVKFSSRAYIPIYQPWYLLPSIKFGLWDHRPNYHNNQSGGFIGFSFLKFDATLMWTVTHHDAMTRGRK